MNKLNDLFSREELKEYFALPHPFNIPMLRAALDEKLKENTDYEVFAPLVYYNYLPYTTRVAGGPIPMMEISNKGEVISTFGGKRKTLSTHIQSGGYKAVSTTRGNNYLLLPVHRALGCTFIPVPESLGGKHPRELEVNHVDGIKLNIELGNLEWTTKLGNNTHAVETGLIKSGADSKLTIPVKGTVARGPYTGTSFILFGKSDFDLYGFTQPLITTCCKGRVKTHRGCYWTYATDDELKLLPRGIDKEVANTLG